jgi:hypothetical protein
MNPEEFRKKLQCYVVVNETTPGDHDAEITQARCFSGGNEILDWHPGPCDDCGQIVTKPIRRQLTRLKVSGWRERCMNCNRLRDPVTGVFDVEFGKITTNHQRQLASQRYHLKRQSGSTVSCPNVSKCDSAASVTEHESLEPCLLVQTDSVQLDQFYVPELDTAVHKD